MSDLLERIRKLVSSREGRVSEHGLDELTDDGISVRDALQGLQEAILIEEYPASGRGPALLVLEYDQDGKPIHVVWGIPAGHESPAVLITGYRPDPDRWDESFTKAKMRTLNRVKYVHEGKYVAEVDVELIEDDSAWSPYLSLDDAEKLDDIRAALARGDVDAASQQARVYTLQPVAASR